MNGINWGNNNLFNPTYNYPQIQMPAPQMQVIKVSGENGVDAFQIGPNSSVLLLDETAPIVWFVQTDGAGYKTKTPYDITLHTPETVPDVKGMEEMLLDIDKRLKYVEEAMRDESDN